MSSEQTDKTEMQPIRWKSIPGANLTVKSLNEMVHAALFILRYPTTNHWLLLGRMTYEPGMSAVLLASAIRRREDKPIKLGGVGAAMAAVPTT